MIEPSRSPFAEISFRWLVANKEFALSRFFVATEPLLRLLEKTRNMLRIRIRDPVPFLTLGSGMGKKSGSGSKMNNPDHISERLGINILGLKDLNS